MSCITVEILCSLLNFPRFVKFNVSDCLKLEFALNVRKALHSFKSPFTSLSSCGCSESRFNSRIAHGHRFQVQMESSDWDSVLQYVADPLDLDFCAPEKTAERGDHSRTQVPTPPVCLLSPCSCQMFLTTGYDL